jgi:hypothetical protein
MPGDQQQSAPGESTSETVPTIPCSLCYRMVQPEALWVSVLVSKDEQDGECDRQQVLLSHFLCYTQFLEDNGCRQFTGKVFHLTGLSSQKDQVRVYRQAQKIFDEARAKDMARMVDLVKDENSAADASGSATASQSTSNASPGMKRKLSSSDSAQEKDASNGSPAKRHRSAFRRACQTTTSYVSKWRKGRKLEGPGACVSSGAVRKDDPSRKAGLPLTRSATGRRQKTVS